MRVGISCALLVQSSTADLGVTPVLVTLFLLRSFSHVSIEALVQLSDWCHHPIRTVRCAIFRFKRRRPDTGLTNLPPRALADAGLWLSRLLCTLGEDMQNPRLCEHSWNWEDGQMGWHFMPIITLVRFTIYVLIGVQEQT